jgi:hypothetical protein
MQVCLPNAEAYTGRQVDTGFWFWVLVFGNAAGARAGALGAGRWFPDLQIRVYQSAV